MPDAFLLTTLVVIPLFVVLALQNFMAGKKGPVPLLYGSLGLSISAVLAQFSLYKLGFWSFSPLFIGSIYFTGLSSAVVYLFFALQLTRFGLPRLAYAASLGIVSLTAVVLFAPWPWGGYAVPTVVGSSLLAFSLYLLADWMRKATDERARRDGQWMILVYIAFAIGLVVSVFHAMYGVYWLLLIWYAVFHIIIHVLRIFEQSTNLENQLIMDNVFDLVIITDPEGHVVRLNRRGQVLTGWPATNVKGLGLEEMVIDNGLTVETRTEWLRDRAHFDSGIERTPSFDCFILGAGKEEIPVDMRVVCLLDLALEVTGYIISATDMRIMHQLIKEISDREFAARDLALSESKFSRMFIFNPAGIIILDPETGYITDANPAIEEILDSEAVFLRGRRLQDVGLTMDDAAYGTFIEQALMEGSVAEFTSTFIREDGRQVLCRIAAVSFDLNKARRVLISVTNITDEERMREALERKKKLETIGFLAGGIAHDFNNILAVILGHIGLARLSITDDNIHGSLMKAERACLRARALTGQLLTFSRGGKPVLEVCETASLIREPALEVCSGSTVSCSFELPSDLWPVVVDRIQIGQVISNIVVNAMDAMSGKGDIKITARNFKCLSQPAQKRPAGTDGAPLAEGNYVEIRIRDTGPGVPHKVVDRLFDPFFSTKQKGSGLGLAIVLSIVQNHKGSIRLGENGPDGAEFVFLIPADPSGVLPESALTCAIERGRRSVLLMDDDQLVLDTARSMLYSLGYQVVTATHGLEALDLYIRAAAEGFPFDITILDLIVPGGLSGADTARSILEYDPAAVLLVSSGYSNEPVLSAWAAHGFKGVIPKPYTLDELAKAIAAVPKKSPGAVED